MRQMQIFSGTSHPELVERICDFLGIKPGMVELGKFSNGETSVQIRSSIRNQDVFIVQSGSESMNDSVMELLIMISACKGGSARSITAVMPYFPYSRQSKKKAHRASITARMIANLLHVAGVSHVITVDLHATQMQGFFKCPVDNLVAEPLLARWIKHNVSGWKDAVVVSKNPGGTKRVTSLADALKLNFGIVTTDRRIPHYPNDSPSVNGSLVLERFTSREEYDDDHDAGMGRAEENEDVPEDSLAQQTCAAGQAPASRPDSPRPIVRRRTTSNAMRRRVVGSNTEMPTSPLARATLVRESPQGSPPRALLARTVTTPVLSNANVDGNIDERARDVIHGRLVHGHIVDEDFPSPSFSAMSSSTSQHRAPLRANHSIDDNNTDPPVDPMTASFLSTGSSLRREEHEGLGGSGDAGASSEEEEEDLRNPHLETTVTLVGNVKDRQVIIVDDMIDKAASWIAAAETAVKRGGATGVICMATHGLFGGDSLEEMASCQCIEKIVVTNSFPIDELRKERVGSKLYVLDLSSLLSEAVRRNHNGESISQLFMHFTD